ncbi:MAG: metal-dependent transcriptional regulator [Candidatus Hodarchaeota archaeon]
MSPEPSQDTKPTEASPTEPTTRSSTLPSTGMEEYLEAIYRLLKDEDRYVKTGELAEALKVQPGSVTEMVKKLTEKKYLKYQKNRGFRLTRKGRNIALDVLRRHRVAERLLVDLLGVSWEEAHDVACQWEHMLSPEMCDQVLDRLNGPATCPHGNPIPESNGFLTPLPELSLADLEQGEQAVIDCISDENVDLLRMMSSMGMLPGETVRVLQVSPIGDTLLIEVGTAQFALSCKLAQRVLVHREDDED